MKLLLLLLLLLPIGMFQAFVFSDVVSLSRKLRPRSQGARGSLHFSEDKRIQRGTIRMVK